MASSKFQSKNTVLTKKLNNVLYELMVKTRSDMVYIDDSTTLTERLSEITDLLIQHEQNDVELKQAYEELVGDSNSSYNSFKEIWDYINVNGNPKSELIKLIDSKQASEEGKGLSECDFTSVMREKLVNGYSKEELDEKFEFVMKNAVSQDILDAIENLENKSNTVVSQSASGDAYDDLADGSCWYQVIAIDGNQ